MSRAVLLSIPACLMLGACGELFGDLVQQPRDATIMMVYNMPSADNLMMLPQRFPNVTVRAGTSEEGVVWTYLMDGKEACRFTAHVKEETPTSSVVWTEMDDVSAEGEGYLCETVRIAGEESVAAVLEGRPVNRQAVEAAIAAAMVNNMGSVHKTLGRQVEAATAEFEPRDCHRLGTTAQQQACRSGKPIIP
jgi:hypothetical protein